MRPTTPRVPGPLVGVLRLLTLVTALIGVLVSVVRGPSTGAGTGAGATTVSDAVTRLVAALDSRPSLRYVSVMVRILIGVVFLVRILLRLHSGGPVLVEPQIRLAPVYQLEPRPEPTRLVRSLQIAGGVAAGIVALVALTALPLLAVKSNSEAAVSDLRAAASSLLDDDIAEAQARVASARHHVDRADSATSGVLDGVWSRLPVVGPVVGDVDHLVAALDGVTAIAETGVKVYPQVIGPNATLVVDQQVDLGVLDQVIAAVDESSAQVTTIREALTQIRGDNPVLGPAVLAARDEALGKIDGVQSKLDEYQPMLHAFPDLLAAGGQRKYLIALLNPSELRFSGGATLSLSRLTVTDGKLEFTEGEDLDQLAVAKGPIEWPAVTGNVFHEPGPQSVHNATFAPSWAVSGEELLRSLEVAAGESYDAVVTADVITLARLLGVTGPIQTPGYGELSADNLVKLLVGSYDIYNNVGKRHQLNDAIIPAFQAQVLESGHVADKIEVLKQSAEGRHFAVYFRDGKLQRIFRELQLTGELSPTNNDYIGVFTQNNNASKVDYYQQRKVTSKVKLYPDGSAIVDLRINLYNDTPPFAQEGEDPMIGYYTRWARMELAAFLPVGATVLEASYQGMSFEPVDPYLKQSYRRPYIRRVAQMPPQGRYTMRLIYRVPRAATPAPDGTLTYELAVDPQGLVNPSALTVIVKWPDGFTVTSLPDGWVQSQGASIFSTPGLDFSPRWDLVARADGTQP